MSEASRLPSNQRSNVASVDVGAPPQRKRNAEITVYEAQANPADHPKIQGIEGVTGFTTRLG
jgi:hypothetical protein